MGITSFLVLMVLLVNNQASPLPDEAEIVYEGDVPPLKTNREEDADSLSLKTQNDGNEYYEEIEEREDSNNFDLYAYNYITMADGSLVKQIAIPNNHHASTFNN